MAAASASIRTNAVAVREILVVHIGEKVYAGARITDEVGHLIVRELLEDPSR